MGNYIFCIGGSGAKCGEAILHLAATGLLQARDLNLIFIDPDSANGCLKRTQAVARSYRALQDIFSRAGRGSGPSPFHTQLKRDPLHWSPFAEGNGRHLRAIFGLTDNDADSAILVNSYFNEEDRNTDLKEGFRGRPAIGAAVFSHRLDLSDRFWSELREEIKAPDARHRILFVGSVYGGTGAAGLPTLPRLFRNFFDAPKNSPKVFIGGLMLLPYFNFDSPGTMGEKVFADSHFFSANTKAALEYYHQRSADADFDRIYLLGSPTPTKQPVTSVGGESQSNPSHFIELYAALAAAEFLACSLDRREELLRHPVLLAGRESDHRLTWADLPWHVPDAHASVQGAFGAFLRFSFAYAGFFHRWLSDARTGSKVHNRAPWFVDYLAENGVDLTKEDQFKPCTDLHEYSQAFLRWAGEVQQSISAGRLDPASRLFNIAPFYDGSLPADKDKLREVFDLGSFGELLPVTGRVPRTIHGLWGRLAASKPPRGASHAVGELFRQMHSCCVAR